MARRIRLKHHQLAAELAKRRISQNRLAQILGVGKAHLSLLVNGKRPYPTKETRQRLLEGLGVPFSTLFEVEKEQRTAPRWMRGWNRARQEESGMLETLFADLRWSARSLMRKPLYSGTIVLVLALAIGANAATFSWVRALVLAPLLVEEPDRFVALVNIFPSGFRASFSYPTFLDHQRDATALEEVFVQRMGMVSVSTGRDNQRALANLVSASYFRALAAQPLHGRAFGDEEDRVPGRDAVVVLGHDFWQRQLAGDAAAVGAELLVNGRSYTIIGVMPDGFGFGRAEPQIDLFVPVVMQEQIRPGTSTVQSRDSQFLQAYAMIRPGVTLEQAQDAVAARHAALIAEFPDQLAGTEVRLEEATRGIFGPSGHGVATMLTMLLALVGGVLLIACANVAGVMLARAADRAHEMGVRQALGAGRRRLLRQLLTESMLLAAVAGVLGVALAVALNRLLLSIPVPLPFPIRFDVEVDPSVLAYTATAAMLTGLVFGLAPALRASRVDVVDALRGSGRIAAGTRGRAFLVTVQVALSMTLLMTAGMFVRSMQNAAAIDAGFAVEGMLVATLDPGLQGYSIEETHEFFRRLQERTAALPGVAAVGLGEVVPMSFGNQQWGAEIDGYVPAEDERMNLDYNIVGPGYFAAMEIPMIAGREFDWDDRGDAPGAVIINATMARRFWPDASPLGRTLRSGGMTREVVGVVADSKVYSLGEDPLPYLYFPLQQSSQTSLALHVRSDAPVEQVVDQVRGAVRALDAGIPLFDLRSMQSQMSLAMLPARLAASLLGAFGAFAMLLACVGLYGMLSYTVAQRGHEIGIRMALGADRRSVLRLVASRGAVLAGIGVAIGLLGGIATARVASDLLYGVGWLDPGALGGALLAIAVAAVAATVLPARRAAAVDPATALRAG